MLLVPLQFDENLWLSAAYCRLVRRPSMNNERAVSLNNWRHFWASWMGLLWYSCASSHAYPDSNPDYLATLLELCIICADWFVFWVADDFSKISWASDVVLCAFEHFPALKKRENILSKCNKNDQKYTFIFSPTSEQNYEHS